MLYKMRLYRNGNHEPVCEPFEITAEDIEQAREFAWDEYTGNHGDLVAIIEGDDRYVPVTDDKTHEGKQLYEFVLTDENGKDVEVGCPLVAWASDEENAREQVWDMVEFLLYADAEDIEYDRTDTGSEPERKSGNMREYNVTITETLKMTVTVEAESMEEAKQKVEAEWKDGEYILDADSFAGVEFESAEPVVELSYREMADMFSHINKIGAEHLCGYIVFSEDSFDKFYSEQSRTYVISSDNKAFKPNMGGYSIFGSCLDGTDQNIRLEEYMRGKNAWHIDRCYMKKDDYTRAYSQPVFNNKDDHSR